MAAAPARGPAGVRLPAAGDGSTAPGRDAGDPSQPHRAPAPAGRSSCRPTRRGHPGLCPRSRAPGPRRPHRLRVAGGLVLRRGPPFGCRSPASRSAGSTHRPRHGRRTSGVAVGIPAQALPRRLRRGGRAAVRGARQARRVRRPRGPVDPRDHDPARVRRAVHRDRRTHVNDLARDRRLAGLGWTRRGYTSVDLLDRARQMLREADAALGRAHVASRLDRWWALLDESLFTGRGRRRLARRWGLEPR